MMKLKMTQWQARRGFRLFSGTLLGFALCLGQAWAQDLRITFPADNQKVRGEITVKWEGIPEGSYAMVRVDNQLRSATAEPQFTINTMPPNFKEDGPHTISITAINAAGKRTGEAKVTFIIANQDVDTDAEAVSLVHWKPTDIFQEVQRYRVFAESNGIIDTPTGGAGGGGASGGGASSGGGESGGEYIPAPLDWQVTALLRRIVRDVGMIDDSANIRTVVDNSFQRQRLSESGGNSGGESSSGAAPAASSKKKKKGPGFPVKAPWNYEVRDKVPFQLWDPAPETGQYFVKMIKTTGEEINATRKANTLAIADLLPTFPEGPVRPGNTWETTMTFLGELSQRKPIDVVHRMLFSSFDTIKTPAQVEVRAAKLESRFQLPESKAKEIAVSLASMGLTGGGSGGGAGGSGGGGGAEGGTSSSGKGASSRGSSSGGGSSSSGAGGAAADFDPDLILSARTNVSRVLWFDITKRRVVRCEDRLNTVFEMESASAGGGESGSSSAAGGQGQGATGGGADAEPAEPTKVTYNLFIITEFDDTIPRSTPLYTAGDFTAHRDVALNPDDPTLKKPNNRDKTLVRDPSLARILKSP